MLAIATMACASGQFPTGTKLVIVNRTETPVVMSVGLVAACEEVWFDQRQLDAAIESVTDGAGPPVPANAVDLSNVAIARPLWAADPSIVVIAMEGSHVAFGTLDRDALPACQGKAQPLP